MDVVIMGEKGVSLRQLKKKKKGRTKDME